MKAVILAGGKGNRLHPYTYIIPKPLMPLGGIPIIEIILKQLKRDGIRDIILAVGHQAHMLRAHFSKQDLGIKITYSEEDHPLGTAGPLSLIDGLDETFLVINGDTLSSIDYNRLLFFHKNLKPRNAIATICLTHREVQTHLGVIDWVNELDCKIKTYKEKPVFDFLASMGIYVFEPRILDFIPYNAPMDFPELINNLLRYNEFVAGYQFEGYWMDLGNPDDYRKANDDFDDLQKTIMKGTR